MRIVRGTICGRRLPSGKFMTIKYEFDLGHYFSITTIAKMNAHVISIDQK